MMIFKLVMALLTLVVVFSIGFNDGWNSNFEYAGVIVFALILSLLSWGIGFGLHYFIKTMFG
jgi:hypothetical protein